MGVPAFFRWLSRKYPSIVTNCVEDKAREINGVTMPVDCTGPNPHGIEFDNLYLDMNGIVHPCTHPEDRPAPKNEAEMMLAIFESIDRIMRIVRPRRVLYLAVDGVAPRAKMNQQRSRRFRAAKEARDKREAIEQMRADLQSQGIPLPPAKQDGEHFDSNCITPGTPFMWRLSECLRFYIHERLSTDPAWKTLTVILSDANVPGEGEHKIMDFIRRQRASPGHDPNTHHVLCGADADLIMLGLATHEPYFSIIREEFLPNQQRPCELCGQYGHELKQCQGLAKIQSGEYDEISNPFQREKNYIFIRLSVLREYLQKDLFMPNLPFKYDFERAIDDWVFMCFFVGNDFLPHLPSLEIRENAIDRLIKLYKTCVYKTRGYLTENGLVNLNRVQLIMSELGEVEDEIFKDRQRNELARKEKDKQRRRRMERQSMPSFFPSQDFSPVGISQWDSGKSLNAANLRKSAYEERLNFSRQNKIQSCTDLRSAVDDSEKLKSLMSSSGLDLHSKGSSSSLKRQKEDDEDEEEVADDVRLWEDGFKERYYLSKFRVSSSDTQFRYRVAHAYVEGLCWVLRYYYQGCCSWKWYFPYHYAPFASDFVGLGSLKISFDSETKAIKPLEQLMSVFPAASRSHVPEPWADLMINTDSPIIDFYPVDFKVDLNGKKYAWQGVALLPFVDACRLDHTLQTVYKLLTDDEKQRNTVGNDRLFVSVRHQLYPFLQQIYDDTGPGTNWIAVDKSLTHGMSGLTKKDHFVTMPKNVVKSPLHGYCPDLTNNVACSVLFMDPTFDKTFIFEAKRLEGVEEPAPTLKPDNWDDSKERYRPQVGFTRDLPRASMSNAGNRFLRSGLALSAEESSYMPAPRYNLSRAQYERSSRSAVGRGDMSRTPYDYRQRAPNFAPRPPYNFQRPVVPQAGFVSRGQMRPPYDSRRFRQPQPQAAAHWAPPPRGPIPPLAAVSAQLGSRNRLPYSGRPSAADYF